MRHPRPHRHLPHGPILLPRWQRWLVWGSMGLLTLSGLAWLGLQWAGSPGGDELPSGTSGQLWCIRVHAAAALLALLALGSLLPLHIRTAWRARRNRASGVLNLVTLALLVITGYALWYASEGAFRQGSAWLHWSLGCAVPLALLVHVLSGRHAR